MQIDILRRGAPRVANDKATVIVRESSLIAVTIALTSPHCRVSGQGGTPSGPPCIWLEATPASSDLDDTRRRDAMTGVSLPDLLGWEVFCAEAIRNELRVCLRRDR